ETPRSAFAPRFFLFGVPSSSMSLLSIFACSRASPPLRTGAILLLTLATAFLTPLPPKRLVSSSRNSHASCSPVLAPLGTAAPVRRVQDAHRLQLSDCRASPGSPAHGFG